MPAWLRHGSMSNDDAAVLLSQPEWPLLVALAIGLLIGLERERRKGEGATRSPAGCGPLRVSVCWAASPP